MVHKFVLNQKEMFLPVDEMEKAVLSTGNTFTGSVSFKEGSLIFDRVNKEEIGYIFSKIKNQKEEVTFELQTDAIAPAGL